MAYKLRWAGPAVVERVVAKTAVAEREVVRRAAEQAATNHPWTSETGATEAGIWAGEPRIHGDLISTPWGAPSPAYFLEVGTVHMPAFPFLRPAADANYPMLAGLIAASEL